MFMVVARVEMPLESSRLKDYWIDPDGTPRCEDVPATTRVHYGPFGSESDAAEYARVVDGRVHELVLPVTA